MLGGLLRADHHLWAPASHVIVKASHTAIVVKLGSGTIYVEELLGLMHSTVLGPAAEHEQFKAEFNGNKSEQGRQNQALSNQQIRF